MSYLHPVVIFEEEGVASDCVVDRAMERDLVYGAQCFINIKHRMLLPKPKNLEQEAIYSILSTSPDLATKYEIRCSQLDIPLPRPAMDEELRRTISYTRRLNRAENQEFWSSKLSDCGSNQFFIQSLFWFDFGGKGFGEEFFFKRCNDCFNQIPADRACLFCMPNRANYGASSLEQALCCLSTWHQEQLEADICLRCQEKVAPEVTVKIEYWDSDLQEKAQRRVEGERYDEWFERNRRSSTPSTIYRLIDGYASDDTSHDSYQSYRDKCNEEQNYEMN